MKKIILCLCLGWIIHMLYIDFIFIYQINYINNCPELNIKDYNKTHPNDVKCMEYGNSIDNNFKLKYFNIANLIKWKNVQLGEWSMQ